MYPYPLFVFSLLLFLFFCFLLSRCCVFCVSDSSPWFTAAQVDDIDGRVELYTRKFLTTPTDVGLLSVVTANNCNRTDTVGIGLGSTGPVSLMSVQPERIVQFTEKDHYSAHSTATTAHSANAEFRFGAPRPSAESRANTPVGRPTSICSCRLYR